MSLLSGRISSLMGFAKHNKPEHIKSKTPKYTSVEVNQYDKNQCTALWHAVSCSALEAAKILVEFGANLNMICGPLEETCLHQAIKIGDKSVIDFLLESGANHSILNKDLKTPIYYSDKSTKDKFKLWKVKTSVITLHDFHCMPKQPLRKDITQIIKKIQKSQS